MNTDEEKKADRFLLRESFNIGYTMNDSMTCVLRCNGLSQSIFNIAGFDDRRCSDKSRIVCCFEI